MSKIHKQTIICPCCKKEYVVDIWDSINAQLNPKMKEKILAGNLYKTICPHCNTEINCIYDFLYHDMDKNYMISIKQDYSEVQKEYQKLDNYRFRITEDINELVEKIKIFDTELNDIIIETTKVIVKEIMKITDDLLFWDKNNFELQFLITPKENDKNAKIIKVPMEIYHSAAEACTDTDLKELGYFTKVDENYIRKLITDTK